MRRFVVVCYIRSEEAMKRICKLYVRICRRIGPCHMTVSAWAWQRELDGRGYLLRELIDDFFLCFRDEEDHCLTHYLRETASTQRTDSRPVACREAT
jgi:hypothetical protein